MNSTQKIISVIKRIEKSLNILIKSNEDAVKNKKIPEQKSSLFFAKNIPEISIKDYLLRFQKNAPKSCEVDFIAMLIYLDRYIENTNEHVEMRNIHRLLLASYVLTLKYWEDDVYQNKYSAEVGGVSLKHLNELEVEFLFALNCELYISEETYSKYESAITRLKI